MSIKRIISALLAIILAMGLSIKVNAAGSITLDGSFDDWADKPSLAGSRVNGDSAGDFAMVKWFPDTTGGSLYLYAERAEMGEAGSWKWQDWDYQIHLNGGSGWVKAVVSYHPPSRFVDTAVYDSNGRFLWGEKGKWGDEKEEGRRVELKIPFYCLTGSTSAGYEVSMYFQGESGRLPGSGDILVSTVSTFPLGNLLLVGMVCGAGVLASWKRMLPLRISRLK